MIYCLPVELAETTVSKPLKRGRTFKKCLMVMMRMEFV